jgi:LPS-assembly lipoprotein
MIARRTLSAFILGLPLAFSGCGWTPLYADPETPAADAELRAVRVYPIPNRTGQRLETALRNAFNPDGTPSDKRYELRVILQTQRQSLGIQSQGLGTRGEVSAIVTYTLSDLKDGATLTTSTVHVTDSFDIQANSYSTVVAEEDAYKRLVEELRGEILTRLTVFLQRRKTQAPA